MKPESTPDDLARARRAKAFTRRSAAAIAGTHLPTYGELLRLQPFCGNNHQIDARLFAERVMVRLRPHLVTTDLVREALQALAVSTEVDVCLDASLALRMCAEEDKRHSLEWEEHAQRCEYYAAVEGDSGAMWRTAGYAVQRAENTGTPEEEALQFGVAAIGWLLVAAGKAEHWPRYWKPRHVGAHDLGKRLLDRFFKEREHQLNQDTKETVEAYKAKADGFGSVLLSMKGKLSANWDEEDQGSGEDKVPPTAIVLRALGNSDVSDGKKIANEFKQILNVPLRLCEVPDLTGVRATLVSEFPYASQAIDAILSDLSERPYIKLRPTILVGEPGGGKTWLARRLMEVLGVPCELYSCGGVGDSSLAGTARRWSTGEPSLPVTLMRRHLCASPGIILDEIEKAGTSRHNGALLDALLGLMEPTSAEAWHDPYVQAAVDVRHVVWLGTANSVDAIPAPLRDRCRRLTIPMPQAEHLVAIGNAILRKEIADRGLDDQWAIPLDGVEIAALKENWSGGSIRILQQLVGAVLKVRDKFNVSH